MERFDYAAAVGRGELTVPPFDLPHSHQLRAGVDTVQADISAWARRQGLLLTPRDAAVFDAARLGWLTCATYPHADDTTIALTGHWFAWYFLFDDILDGTRDGLDVDYTESVIHALTGVFAGADRPHPSPLVEACRRALTDLWDRTAAAATSAWQDRFVRDFTAYLTAHRTQAEINNTGVPPDEHTYVPLRRHAGAMWTCEDVIEITTGLPVDDELLTHPDIHAMREATANLVLWSNDLWSAPKELSSGDVCNYVAVLHCHRNIPLAAAAGLVAELITAETTRFLAAEDRARTHLLPSLAPEQRRALQALIDALGCWPAGNAAWSVSSARYRTGSRSGLDLAPHLAHTKERRRDGEPVPIRVCRVEEDDDTTGSTWFCTLAPRHDGDHEAWTAGILRHRWPRQVR